VGTYRRILAVPSVAPLVAATVLGRLPLGINSLAVVLFLRAETGSFGTAGAVAGALALGSGVSAPVQGRWIDRRGEGVLTLLAAAHALALVALIVLGRGGAAPAALVACGFAAGVAVPPLSTVLRPRWSSLLADDLSLLPSAFALDSVLTEILFVGGPLITGALVAIADPAAALLVSGGAAVLGTALFLAALPPRAEAPAGTPRPSRAGALASPGIRTLVLAMLPVGFAFGAVEVGLPAFADHEGHRELASVLIAVWSAGSAAGGLLYGLRPRRRSLARVHLGFALLLPLGFLPLLAAPSIPVMALLSIPAGLSIAPLIATRNELAGAAAPAGTEVEAYSWPLMSLVGGIALGAAVAGSLADGPGWHAAVLSAVVAAGIGAVVTASRRGTLPTSTVADPARARA
jgi:MFS family permease